MYIQPGHNPERRIDELSSELIALLELCEKPVADSKVRLAELSKRVVNSLPDVLECLEELKQWRLSGEGSGASGGFRAILEGYSEESGAAALALALDKAALYFSEQHDVAITVQSMATLPGGGHRATIEVHMTPVNLRLKPEVKGNDIELKRIHDHEYYRRRHLEEGYLQHLIFDHFSACKGACPVALPEYFMINISDAAVLNHMLEKQFLGARDYSPKPSAIHHILVRTKAPEPEPALKRK